MRCFLHAILLSWLAESIQASEPHAPYGAEPKTIPALIDKHRRAIPDIEVETRFHASDELEGTETLKMTISKGSLNSHKRRFVKAMGLRHKPTMDWGMRARARDQVHWDKYWNQLETGQWTVANVVEPTSGDKGSGPPDIAFSSRTQGVDRASEDGFDDLLRSEGPSDSPSGIANMEEESEPQCVDMNMPFSQESSSTGTTSDDDPGFYFFQQVLDHFPTLTTKPSEGSSQAREFTSTFGPESAHEPASPGTKNTFRQYYHVSSEFYKPGGPVILWLPGETPLHSLFLRRGLAYEMANATSGLLVALEHRFYGKSIPQFQDTPPSNLTPGNDTKQKREDDSESTGRGWGSWEAAAITPSSLKTNGDTGSKSRGDGVVIGVGGRVVTSGSNKNNNKHHDPKHTGDTDYDSSAKEGLPLDLLEYLTVDQAIEDIVSFIDIFPTLQQPLFFGSRSNSSFPAGTSEIPTSENGSDSATRWILAGCSYGGNLAAWTRQRYPSKIFAAFASSAPVRSALDFFEYSSSQTDVLGPRCSQDLAAARDFLDSALQMTDSFMDQMSSLSYGDDFNATSSNRTEKQDQIDATITQQPMEEQSTDKQRRYNAKLEVLSWFSPDFAHEYAVDGEEVHAAGWIWWTVASAVQYNAVVTPPTTLPAKTSVDVLCDTMAELRDKSSDPMQSEATYSPVAGISETRALASWFKDQQYFTPTKTTDLQPSDIDPNSVQNLAGMAWLWQTCSELGYLQTSHPSACCCKQSDSRTAKMETRSGDMHAENEVYSAIAIDLDIVSLTPKGICSLRDWIFRAFRVPSLVGEELAIPLMSASYAHLHPMPTTTTVTTKSTTPCLPCQCYSKEAQRTDSVFSRLLTLEAAWQECQFYFADPEGQNQEGLHPVKKKQLPLLKSYPDVERNVNNKFRGWEIAEDDEDQPVLVTPSDNVQGMSQYQETTGDDVREAQDDIAAVVEALGTNAGTSSPLSQPRSVMALESELHSGGRYYFTNGEYDPWKELTLASSSAQAFLSQRNSLHRAGQKQKKAGDPETLISPSFPDKTGIIGVPLPSPLLELHSHVKKDHCHHLHHHCGEDHESHKQRRHNSRHQHRRPYRPVRDSDSGSVLSSVSQDPQPMPYLRGSNIAVGVDGDDDENDETFEDTLTLSDAATEIRVEGSPTEGPSASPSSESTPSPSVKVVPESLSLPQTTSAPMTPIDNRLIDEGGDEEGYRTVMRIIPGASHCQDILYESSDLDSVELREERQHVLNTFVRWIALDVKRQEQQRQRQTATSATGPGVK